MLRTRKKDINLKPNRILDKRSSRGMLYENEELRLRTIHINDEVDKGQVNIKKLKKENEQLKREIWALRDECEKLEKMLKKVYTAIEESGTFEGLGISPDTRATMLEFPSVLGKQHFFRRESRLTEDSCDSDEEVDLEEFEEKDEDSKSVETLEDVLKLHTEDDDDQVPEQIFSLEIHPCQHLTTSSVELKLNEHDMETSDPSETTPALPIDTQTSTRSILSESPPICSLPPIIEITLASSSHTFQHDDTNSTHDVQNVTSPTPIFIPEKRRVTTQVFLESPPTEILSHDESHKKSSVCATDLQHRRKSFIDKYKNDESFLGDFKIPMFSQSEPNLNSFLENSVYSKLPPPSTYQEAPNWDPNVLIGHIETGNGVSGKSSYKLSDLRVEEIIDELERELGSNLTEVAGVRLLGSSCPIRILISFRSSSEVFQSLAESGRMVLRNGDVRMRLVEAKKKCSLVHLFTLPPQIPDNHVIRVLNQFGQVVAPLERTYYKGVDVCERVARMYVCRKLPQLMNIEGYESPAKISSQSQHSLSRPFTPITQDPITSAHILPLLKSESDAASISAKTLHPLSNTSQKVQGAMSSASVLQTDAGSGSEKTPVIPCPCLLTGKQLPLLSGSSGVEGPPASPPIQPKTVKLPKSNTGNVVIANPPAEVSFYRSISHGHEHDARRRSSAARLHLMGVNLKELDSEGLNMAQAYGNRSRNQHSQNSGAGRSEKKHLPWFSCFGNGCV